MILFFYVLRNWHIEKLSRVMNFTGFDNFIFLTIFYLII